MGREDATTVVATCMAMTSLVTALASALLVIGRSAHGGVGGAG